MEEQRLTHKPHVGAEPVKAEPNHVREKTYQPPNAPQKAQQEDKKLPDGKTRDKISDEMSDATKEVNKRL